MLTRSKAGIRTPKTIFNLQATRPSSISPLPKTYQSALKDPNWYAAMLEENNTLLANHTCELVPPPPSANVVSGKWIFHHKTKVNGSLDHYKAHWVLRGFSQQQSIDYKETFSLVVKPATIRTILTLALSH